MDPEVEPQTELVDDPEHGGVEDTELEAAARATWAPEPDDAAATTEPEAEAEGAEAEAGDEGREGEPSSPAPEPDFFDLGDGIQLQREEARTWAQFQAYLRANPAAAQAVADALEAQQTQATPPTPSTAGATPDPTAVPEGIDLDDPAIAALWNQHQSTLAAMAQLQATVERHDQFVEHSQRETTESLLATARANYQKDHNLSDAEMQNIYDTAGRLQVLPAIMGSVDPITGNARQIDPLTAMQEAFGVAHWQIPELRERELQSRAEEGKAENKRKQKLSSLGGSSGVTPKTAPKVSSNPQERREQMIQAVAEMTGMTGEGAN